MLDPMTGIRLGEEVDALREENARLRAAVEKALSAPMPSLDPFELVEALGNLVEALRAALATEVK